MTIFSAIVGLGLLLFGSGRDSTVAGVALIIAAVVAEGLAR